MGAQKLRRGLPRVVGGDGWPPAGDVETADAPAVDAVVEVAPVADAASVAAPVADAAAPVVETAAVAQSSAPVAASAAPAAASGVRRGLPRTPGGEPWPPSDAAPSVGAASAAAPSVAAPSVAAPAVSSPVAASVDAPATSTPSAAPVHASSAPAVTAPAPAGGGSTVRRGLPRTTGGEPWPPAGTSAQIAAVATAAPEATVSPATVPSATTAVAVPVESSTAVAPVDVSAPLPFRRTVFAGEYAFARPAPVPEPVRMGPFTKGQWAGAVIVGGIGLLGAAAMAVLFVRWLLSLSGMQDFLQTYPGEYHLPEGAPVGFPSWLGWQHFFNVFLIVLIIRSGLSVRHDERPTAFWTARGNGKTKISLTLWFHQALDILWLVNGIVFVILLFVTGQWMRVIPTSWEVFPNALSAVLQYVSLDWPTENGWVNYNSLQQLAYGTTIFVAAPLAAITGVRMSGLWPKNAAKLNKAYPVELARALHFPVMLYFVVFIFVHVALVLATGALRNLNHMYAAQGSIDGIAYADNWTGFWMLVASLVVIAIAWVAARPLVLAPIAKLFGTVSAR
ncbi:cytochrome b/b6 domain-containing protein [Microbacterium sp. A93]|uniref:cytochrome b/b6 domain-containing protein n=1 Tax=Microbacterium sp. A93 TaxID=3450716 RepID=UPI003F428EE5